MPDSDTGWWNKDGNPVPEGTPDAVDFFFYWKDTETKDRETGKPIRVMSVGGNKDAGCAQFTRLMNLKPT